MDLERVIRAAPEIYWALAVFVVAIPIEHWFGTGHRPTQMERLGNLGAMLVNFLAGSLLLNAVLARPEMAAYTGFPDAPRWRVLDNPWLYGFSAMFLVDGLYYVYHRLQHSVPLLWRIHALHHTDPAVNITTAKRTHFLERPLQFLLLVMPVLWLLGYNERGVGLVAVAGPAILYFSHLDVRLSLGALTPVVVGPQYHRIHHALDAHEQGRNFAQAFPLFDKLGGTYRAPREREFIATGSEGCEQAYARWRPIVW